MSEGKYALEHWRSRALVAEKERDSARAVLARLRGYFRLIEEKTFDEGARKYLSVRSQLRLHDQEHWNRNHALDAVTEALTGTDDDG